MIKTHVAAGLRSTYGEFMTSVQVAKALQISPNRVKLFMKGYDRIPSGREIRFWVGDVAEAVVSMKIPGR